MAFAIATPSNASDVPGVPGIGVKTAAELINKYGDLETLLKSADEMYAIFKDVPESLENTVKIAEQCNVKLPLGEYHLPSYPVPENKYSAAK